MKWRLFLARVSYTGSRFSFVSIIEYRRDVDIFEGSSLSDVTYYFIWRNAAQWARAFSFTRFLGHTQRRTTVGRTLLDE